MQRSFTIGLAVIFLGGALYFGLSARESAKRDPASSSLSMQSDKVAELEQELARMKKDVKRVSMKSDMIARMSSASPAIAASLETENQETVTPKETPEEFETRMEEQRNSIAVRFDNLSQAYQQEIRDPGWSDDAETELRSVLRQLEGSGANEATVLTSECKNTMCRIDLAYNDPQSMSSFSRRIRSPLFGGSEARQFDENGRLRSTTYIFRAGYDSSVPW